jgi:hypothetical protein
MAQRDSDAAPTTPRDVLAQTLRERPDLLELASAIFDYAQYLLDDDQRLTKGGTLDGQGRDLLKARALELLGGPAHVEADDDDEAVDDADATADEPYDDEVDE